MPSRRTFLTAIGAAACTHVAGGVSWAQAAPGAALPLENLGLEHLDIVVPDPAASAAFYARVFKTVLHQQPMRDSIRYFVLLGDLPADRQVGYIAIGAAAGRTPAIGHYCTLAKTYDRAGMARVLEAAGFSGVRGAGGLGMWPDPDGLELQLFQPPAGLVTAAVNSPLPVDGEGVVAPIGVDHVLLLVSDVERSLPYYRLVYGAQAEAPRRAGDARVWFNLARGTRIGLQKVTDGAPRIGHVAIRTARFDRGAVTGRLQRLGASVLPSPDEADVLRFRDHDGIVMELQVAG